MTASSPSSPPGIGWYVPLMPLLYTSRKPSNVMQGVSLKSPNRPTGVEKQLKCADGKKNCATLFGPQTALFRELLLRGVLVGAVHYLADNTARKRPNSKRVEAGKVLTCTRFSVPARLGSGRHRAVAECSQRQIHVITRGRPTWGCCRVQSTSNPREHSGRVR